MSLKEEQRDGKGRNCCPFSGVLVRPQEAQPTPVGAPSCSVAPRPSVPGHSAARCDPSGLYHLRVIYSGLGPTVSGPGTASCGTIFPFFFQSRE